MTTIKLTAKQEAALLDAYQNKGSLFQTPLVRKHSPNVLATLVKKGLLEQEKSEAYWTLTDAGREALKSVY